MRIIARSTLREFWEAHPDAEGPLIAWFRAMKAGTFRNANEIKATFPYVSLLADDRVCFNIGGNKYRLVVHVRYDLGIVFIKDALTHQDYDKLNL